MTAAHRLALSCLLLATPAVSAQSVLPSIGFGEALQYTDQGQFRGCGWSVNVLHSPAVGPVEYATFSVSFWLASGSRAIIKTVYGTFPNGTSSKPKTSAISSSWSRIAGSDPVQVLQAFPGENDAILGFAEYSSALAFIREAAAGGAVQIGVKPKGASVERVLAGKVNAPPEQIEQLGLCLREFAARAQ